MKQKKLLDRILKTLIFTILIIYALSMTLLLLWGLITSLKSDIDFTIMGNRILLPSAEWSKNELLLLNYSLFFSSIGELPPLRTFFYVGNRLVSHETNVTFLTMVINTVFYAGGGAVLSTMATCIVGYLVAKFKFGFSKFVYGFALTIMIIPVVGAYPSMLAVLRTLGVYDTYFTHVLQKFMFGGIYFFVFVAFFEGMSDAYFEAAEIDGASQMKIFVHIVIPLAIKIISTVTLIHFVSYWNDYSSPMIYTPTLPTLATGISLVINEYIVLADIPSQCAACMTLAIPILLIFIFFNDKLMGNISMGGIKE